MTDILWSKAVSRLNLPVFLGASYAQVRGPHISKRCRGAAATLQTIFHIVDIAAETRSQGAGAMETSLTPRMQRSDTIDYDTDLNRKWKGKY